MGFISEAVGSPARAYVKLSLSIFAVAVGATPGVAIAYIIGVLDPWHLATIGALSAQVIDLASGD